MARFGTLKRNIRLNITAWDTSPPSDGRTARVAASKGIAVFLALSLAGSLIPLAINIAFRIPDLYGFELGRTTLVEDTGAGVKDSDIGAMISQYMQHKTDSFQVYAGAGGSAGGASGGGANVSAGAIDPGAAGAAFFTANDGAVMGELRSFLDNTLVIGLTSLVLFIVLYIMLVRWSRPRELRRGFLGGVAAYIAILGVVALGIVTKIPALVNIWESVIGGSFTAADRMPQIFHSSFLLLAWGVVAFLTFVVLLILFSFTHRYAQTGRML
jgi:hypothetical protein